MHLAEKIEALGFFDIKSVRLGLCQLTVMSVLLVSVPSCAKVIDLSPIFANAAGLQTAGKGSKNITCGTCRCVRQSRACRSWPSR